VSAGDAPSLWDRMGGIDKIAQVIDATVRMHETDPLTRNYFGPEKFHNKGSHDEVVNSVLTFFATGVGGLVHHPELEYKGRDMVTAHRGMKLTEVAFHALAYHLLTQMERHESGGPAEREEVLTILKAVKADVFKETNEENTLAGFKFVDADSMPTRPSGVIRGLVTDSIPSFLSSYADRFPDSDILALPLLAFVVGGPLYLATRVSATKAKKA